MPPTSTAESLTRSDLANVPETERNGFDLFSYFPICYIAFLNSYPVRPSPRKIKGEQPCKFV
jgi:hypothetical protein